MTSDARPAPSPLLRIAIDYGPLILFFVVNALAPGPDLMRIMIATSAFMIAMFVAMAVSWWKIRHISPMLWIAGVVVLVFGSLTLYFRDPSFIQAKPTLVYATFAVVLGYGLLARKPLLQMLLETAYPGLSEKGWRLLTLNWTLFFTAMAIANEIARHYLAWDGWMVFKTWVVIPTTFLFAAANIPMLLKHGLQLDKPEDVPVPPEG
jgi:intracellular septation protein